MKKTNWKSDSNGKFGAKMLIDQISDKHAFVSEYQSYLEQWQTLDHPAASKIAEFHINTEKLESDVLETNIVMANFSEDTKSAGNQLSFLMPLEKAAILKQTSDLAIRMNKKGISYQRWDMENCYIHPSGICQWLPSTADLRITEEKKTDSLISFALTLFDLKLPESDFEWKDLEKNRKLPGEWVVFFKNAYKKDSPDITDIFGFVFFQSWIYSRAVQFSMKDKIVSPSEYDLLKNLRIFLGIREDQANSLDILALKTDTSWAELSAAFRGQLLAKPYRQDIKTGQERKKIMTFHPDRACTIKEEHVGREDVVFRAYARLATDDIQSFAIIGFCKEGKTSLVNHIRQPEVMRKHLREKADAYSFLYMNLKKISLTNEAGFFKVFYDEVRNIWDIDKLEHGHDLNRITDYLRKNNRKLVVILDNFKEVIVKKEFTVEFYESLRSWFSANKDIGCIVTSPVQFIDMKDMPNNLAGSPFFNIFDSYSVSPLTKKEAAELIRSRLPKSMSGREEDIVRLTDEFGCSPYPLHVVGKIWTEHFLKGKESPDSAIEAAYKELKDYYKEILVRIARADKIRNILENPRQERIDNTLIDLGWVTKKGEEWRISSNQLERFFREELRIPKKLKFSDIMKKLKLGK